MKDVLQMDVPNATSTIKLALPALMISTPSTEVLFAPPPSCPTASLTTLQLMVIALHAKKAFQEMVQLRARANMAIYAMVMT